MLVAPTKNRIRMHMHPSYPVSHRPKLQLSSQYYTALQSEWCTVQYNTQRRSKMPPMPKNQRMTVESSAGCAIKATYEQNQTRYHQKMLNAVAKLERWIRGINTVKNRVFGRWKLWKYSSLRVKISFICTCTHPVSHWAKLQLSSPMPCELQSNTAVIYSTQQYCAVQYRGAPNAAAAAKSANDRKVWLMFRFYCASEATKPKTIPLKNAECYSKTGTLDSLGAYSKNRISSIEIFQSAAGPVGCDAKWEDVHMHFAPQKIFQTFPKRDNECKNVTILGKRNSWF